jgi:NADH dehydrogenase
MSLAGIGLKALGNVPRSPFGGDQYRSLQFDNVTTDNDVGVFGFGEADLRSLADYLGVDPEAAEPDRV